jgi:hypothetical protein
VGVTWTARAHPRNNPPGTHRGRRGAGANPRSRRRSLFCRRRGLVLMDPPLRECVLSENANASDALQLTPSSGSPLLGRNAGRSSPRLRCGGAARRLPPRSCAATTGDLQRRDVVNLRVERGASAPGANPAARQFQRQVESVARPPDLADPDLYPVRETGRLLHLWDEHRLRRVFSEN